ncbi:phage shock protein C (PspC) family protein [Mariniphaga anaerophila]|uniref:Phage shock protein C (PspC) family protein n=1 Tax=Mariniphaga anaerophila TaxID=1484053 RepID=A0A1M5D0Q1_9BACT|nr:PspC domain-containing protein [Mariniphaga anaerophila]SHF60415.1 phage shock protein C (PspC) family protein [Mariniphaga anaerophila]
MKKTFTINISGTVFHIEEDAYEVLQKYLVKLKNHFGTEEEGQEILTDIEARIAEIFSEKSSGEKDVITMAGVEQVIETMGTPEDFAEEEGESEEEIYSKTTKRKRRLYRDTEQRVIGGVCGGLAAYFNMDPVILRIIFVVLFFITSGAGLLAYLILWIAVPKAVTTAQRLEMRGQEATVKNIEKSIKEEVKDVKESYKKFKESDTFTKGKKKVEGAGEVTYNIFRLLLKVAVVIIGVVLIISGFFGLLGLISSLAIGHSFVQDWPLVVWGPEINFPEFLNYLVEPDTVKLGIISVGFLAGIPLLAMLYVGTKLVFNYKSNNTAIGLSMVGVWLIALISLFVISTSQLGNFKNQASVVESSTINCDSCQTIYLKLNEDKYKGYAADGWDLNKLKVRQIDGEKIILGNPRLDIEKSSGNSFIVTVKKSSRGRTRETARDHASDLVYKFQNRDSVLLFDPYFFLNEKDKWRDQEVNITVKVPEGGTIFLDDEMVDIIYDIENVTNTWDGDMVGKYWKMEPKGLTMKKVENTKVEIEE